MKHICAVLMSGVMCVAMFAGCAAGPQAIREPWPSGPRAVPKEIKEESALAARDREDLVEYFEKKAPEKPAVKPIMPRYNPLEDRIVSFSMVSEDLQTVLYSLARSVGMNLILDPGITDNGPKVTLTFQNVPASTVLKEILKTYDLCYEIDRNVIRIRPFQERTFKLDFLDTSISTDFDVGGDVFGASQTESATGLSGSFKLSGKGASKPNVYDLIDEMVRKLKTPEGKYSLNRVAGALYMKDRPGVVAAVARMINRLKTVLSRQILIEARIIEVSLSDEYSYGIDWNLLRGQVSGATKLTEISWSLGRVLAFSGVSRAFTMDAAVDALRTFGHTKIVSNPSIRCKNGRPAVISVGTSVTYKKEVSVTITSTSGEIQNTADVNVSTVFDGLIVGVIPFVDEHGKVTLLINPIKSDVDPDSIEPVKVDDRSGRSISLPRVGIKEISTTISLRNGDVVFLGGLIDRNKQRIDKGVPVLSAVPVVGYLFKNQGYRDETRELVIVLSVKVV